MDYEPGRMDKRFRLIRQPVGADCSLLTTSEAGHMKPFLLCVLLACVLGRATNAEAEVPDFFNPEPKHTIGDLLVQCTAILRTGGELTDEVTLMSERGASIAMGMACNSYVEGHLEALAEGTRPSSTYCLPAQYEPTQMVAVFVKWAQKNPELWHLSRAEGLRRAIQEAFPPRKDCFDGM